MRMGTKAHRHTVYQEPGIRTIELRSKYRTPDPYG